MTQQKQDSLPLLVEAEALAYGGGVIGRVTSGVPELIGKKALVDGAIPGELVEIAVNEESDRLIHGQLLSVLRPSPARRDPPCPKFHVCGGCQLQHMTIESQRHEKLRLVTSTLKAKSGVEPIHQAKLLGESLPEFNYRRRASFHLSIDGSIGFYRKGSGDVVDLEDCLIVTPAIKSALRCAREKAKDLAGLISKLTIEDRSGEIHILCEVRPAFKLNAIKKHPVISFLVNRGLRVSLSQQNSKISSLDEEEEEWLSAGHFSQVNDLANILLVETVTSLIEGDLITELYAGSGNFSLPIALKGQHVDAVEVDKSLVREGERRANDAGLDSKVKFFAVSCEKFMRDYPLKETVLLDPPRSGAKEIVKRLSTSQTRQIVYVSCNLPTFCRDAAQLVKNGYALYQLFMVDMFPQTHHVEMIGEFRALG